MDLTFDEITVVVASHQESIFRSLKEPYLEVCVSFQPAKPFGFTQYVTSSDTSLKYPAAWSEIAVLLELTSFTGDSKYVGLQHYRRFFALEEESTTKTFSLPANKRNEYVENNRAQLISAAGHVLIPKKWEFEISAYEQFLTCHPNLQELMDLSLTEFDKVLLPIFGQVSSLNSLRERNYLYPLNMFVGSLDFYLEWHSLLRIIVPSIEEIASNFQGELGERWGGYIAERLFSVYLTLCQENNRWTFIEKPVVVFDGPDELIQQRDELIQQRDELIQQRDELIQQRDTFVNSTIWRTTKPFRLFVNLCKR
jgi:hypothetical protein